MDRRIESKYGLEAIIIDDNRFDYTKSGALKQAIDYLIEQGFNQTEALEYIRLLPKTKD